MRGGGAIVGALGTLTSLSLILGACSSQATPASLPTAVPVIPTAPASARPGGIPIVPTVTPVAQASTAASAQASASSSASASPVVSAAASSSPSAAANLPAADYTNQNWTTVIANPAQYKGKSVSLTGQVFNVEEDSSRWGVQMWTNPARSEGNTVVVFAKVGFPSVKKDDQISVVGSVDGVFAGRTDSGQTLNLPRVLATRIEILPRGGASPAASTAASASASAKPQASASTSSSPSASASAQGAVSAGTYRVTGAGAQGLSVRTSAGITATNKIGVVHDNELITVSREAAPGWAAVTGDGFTGFVSTTYITGPVTVTSSQPLAKLSKPS